MVKPNPVESGLDFQERLPTTQCTVCRKIVEVRPDKATPGKGKVVAHLNKSGQQCEGRTYEVPLSQSADVA